MTTEERIRHMLLDFMYKKYMNGASAMKPDYSLDELPPWRRVAFLQMVEHAFNISLGDDLANHTGRICDLAQTVDKLKNPRRTFTQANPMNETNVCDGCYQRCKLDAAKFALFGPYYPIIGGQPVTSYIDKDGQKQVITAKKSGNQKTALKLAHQIAELCTYYQKQK